MIQKKILIAPKTLELNRDNRLLPVQAALEVMLESSGSKRKSRNSKDTTKKERYMLITV
jgi:hypothetical protein